MKPVYKVYEELERLSVLSPIPFYWTDDKGIIIGVNKYCFDLSNNLLNDNLIGKSAYELYTPETALIVQEHINEVMTTGKATAFEEELIDIITLEKRYYVCSRSPLFEDNKVIGIVGCITDITFQKEAEKLKHENEKLELQNKEHQVRDEEQEKFKKIVGQMVHDIRSPLSTLKSIVQNTKEIPEKNRNTLRRVAINIEDISNHMLNRYRPEDSILTENNKRQDVLVSTALSEIISERRYKSQDYHIEFDLIIHTPQLSNFAFIKIEPSNFIRMLSNLLNNATEALPKSGGKITLELDINNAYVEITLADNGKGIPLDVLEKIRQKIRVTTGKKNGFGIGLTQIQDVIESNYGKFEIYSNTKKEDRGTTVILKFPQSTTPNWVASQINIFDNDTIVIVDDDSSIHDAWDARFKNILDKSPNLTLHHFISGHDALHFIHNFSKEKHICVLSDYELIHQKINGLQLIKHSRLARCTLVTSNYDNINIRKQAIELGIKVLPKDLAFNVPINIKRKIYKGELNNVHMVFIDDEKEVIDNIIADHYSNLIIDTYNNPFEFINHMDTYPKDTKIILDNSFYNGEELLPLSGNAIAQQLHEKGFTNLILCSWTECTVPDYLKLVLKTDLDAMANLDKL